MKKLILFIFISIFLINLISAQPTVAVISPSGTIAYGYSGLSQALNYTITNGQYCWNNYNGVNSSIPCTVGGNMSVDDNIKIGLVTGGTNVNHYGVEIKVNKAMNITALTKNPSSTITDAQIQTSAGVNISTAYFVGNIAYFNQNLTAGQTYRLVGTKASGQNLIGNTTAVTTPISTEYFNITNGINDDGAYSNQIWVWDNYTISSASSKNITFSTPTSLTMYANDSSGVVVSNTSSWSFTLFSNSINYNSTIIEGSLQTITSNITLLPGSTLSSVILTYNNTNSTPSIIPLGNNYILNSDIIAPTVLIDTNISFYYTFIINGVSYSSQINNQTVTNLAVSTTCSGNYPFLNITNYDEETLINMNGTVEYTLNLLNNNNQITTLNGTSTGKNLTLCTSQNLTNSFIRYNLQLRYYDPNLLYFYKTYNIQNNAIGNVPIFINLFYLNKSIGTQFKINYVDFNYLQYPGAIIQIQRQYLSQDLYNIVEIPSIDNSGQAIGSFNTNNIRYKLIVINNGAIIDTFNDVFPSCQSIVLGTCNLDLRGTKTTTSTTTGDFTYTLTKTNSSLVLTYIIPSGTPRNINFVTNQYSRFLNNISNCNTSIFASGGTITCNYNSTVGDSIIDTQIINSDGTILYGTVMISEDLSSFFMLNNYFIAFIILLSLGLMFISSAIMIVLGAGVGLIYLGLVFLLRGADLVTVSSALSWLIVAIGLIIYYISKKEERT